MSKKPIKKDHNDNQSDFKTHSSPDIKKAGHNFSLNERDLNEFLSANYIEYASAVMMRLKDGKKFRLSFSFNLSGFYKIRFGEEVIYCGDKKYEALKTYNKIVSPSSTSEFECLF